MTATPKRSPTLLQALLPVLFLVGLLVLNVLFFGDGGLGGPNQMALLLAAALAFAIGVYNKQGFSQLLEHVVQSISTALSALLILLMIGALAGTWLISGTVPAMIDHGLLLLSPTFFLFAAAVVCAIVSLATGSSWSTAATVGIALMGIGKALGFSDGLVAGAVISGAYFGDKLSPLSDTTNLAPAVAGTDLFSHIRYMLNTTIPSMSIALLLFLGIGLFSGTTAVEQDLNTYRSAIEGRFAIGWWCYLPPVAVVLMIWRRMPALPALFIGVLLGAAVTLVFQQDVLLGLVPSGTLDGRSAYMAVISAMVDRVQVTTGEPMVDELLTSKGMRGMLDTIWLILCAMTFGGAMEGAQLLQRITREVMRLVTGDGSLIATTAASCVFVNVTASDQYLSIVVPGRMYASVYRDRGLDPKVLSRTLEDAGTVTSPLVPWNTCGAYQSSVLGVATMTYLPFCFFNLLSPLMTVFQGWIGWRIARLSSATEQPGT